MIQAVPLWHVLERGLVKIIVLFCLSLAVTGCAKASRELKAPCGPVASYVENDKCGPLKPANAALEDLATGG